MMNPPRTQPPLRDLEPHAEPGDHVRCRTAYILEDHLAVAMRLVVLAKNGQHAYNPHTERTEWHQHHRVLVMTVLRRVRSSGHEDDHPGPRMPGAARPPFLSVQNDLVPVEDCRRLHVRRIRRRDIRFGHTKDRPDLPGQQGLEPALLLLFGAVLPENLHVP